MTATGAPTYTFRDKGLVAGTLYYYGVRAYAGTLQSDLAGCNVTPVDNRSVRLPVGLASNVLVADVAGDDGTRLAVSFDKSVDDSARVTRYVVWRKLGAAQWVQVAEIPATGAASYSLVDGGLVPGEVYRYGIRAYAGSLASDLVAASGRPL